MKNKKIIVIGCGGSGKSTLSKELSRKLDIPVTHLDQIYWCGNWEHVSNERFDNLLLEVLEREKWIIDGNFNRTLPLRIEKCDTVIYLDFSRITCLYGAFKRVICNYGHTRDDMGGNCPERFDFEFFKWIWNFNKQNRSKYINILNNLESKKVYILRNREEVKKFLETI
ncbi:DNA topology modulation protein [Clostridium perfringens]|nr:DNA topology modulation protein [Clostridium perfringens]